MMDWVSFWTNILAGSVYFIIGVFFSIWLIPKFTIRLLKRKNIIHFRNRITFVISELCEFLNQMPDEFKVNNDSTEFLVKNKQHPDLYDFVAILKPNIFKPTAAEQLQVTILTVLTQLTRTEIHHLVKNEVDRLKLLQKSLEKILTAHSLNIDDKIISKISTLCIAIQLIENEFRFNKGSEILTGKKEGISGSTRLHKIYDMIIELLQLLGKENGIKRE